MLSFYVFALVAAASASVIHDGKCPEVKPVENFNLTAYAGTWYEVSKYPHSSEKNGKCNKAEYTLDGTTGLKIKNTHVISGVQLFVEGTAKFAEDAKNAAKLAVTLKVGDKTKNFPLLVLATDYTSYAVAYNCIFNEKAKNHETHAWILSRSKKLEGASKTAVDTFVKANPVEFEAAKMVATDFSDEACKFTTSSPATEAPAKKQ